MCTCGRKTFWIKKLLLQSNIENTASPTGIEKKGIDSVFANLFASCEIMNYAEWYNSWYKNHSYKHMNLTQLEG